MPNIITTYRCNQNCPYCFAKGETNKSRNDLSLENFDIILKFLNNSNEKEVRLLGGEPTCHPEFKKMVEKAIQEGFSVHIFSNGLFDRSMLEFMKNQGEKIKYSFNINNPKYYTQERWLEINRNLKNLSKISPVRLTFNIFDPNFAYNHILKLAYDFKPRSITLRFTNPIIDQNNKFLSVEDFKKASLRVENLISNFPASSDLFTLCFGCGLSNDIVQKFSNIKIKSPIKSIKIQSGCQGNTGKFDIGPDLEVFRCLPLSNWQQRRLSDFKNIKDVIACFDDAMRKEQIKSKNNFLDEGPCFAYFLSKRRLIPPQLPNSKTLILAIDTTSASSACAIVKNGKDVISNSINAIFFPKIPWGNLLDMLPRYHLDFILDAIDKDFKKNNINWSDVDAIAVSSKSGILSSMNIGVSVAKTLASVYKKSLIEVDHILAHVYALWIERNPKNFSYPILVFSSSGSHSGLFLIRKLNELDVLCGEVPQKVVGETAKYVGIGMLFFEIGHILGIIKQSDKNQSDSINRLCEVMDSGNPNAYEFRTFYEGQVFDFNFLQFMEKIGFFIKEKKNGQDFLNEKDIADIAASFQEAITNIISEKILIIAQKEKVKEIHIAGGISKNEYLKKKLSDRIDKGNLRYVLRYPVKDEYCVDNAAMIGALAYYQVKYDIQFKNFKPLITH